MTSRTRPYILEKDGKYYSFPSEISACEFLGVKPNRVGEHGRSGKPILGYNVIKAYSEMDIYGDKRLIRIWQGMKARCSQKNNTCYKFYGAKGITVCKEWWDDYLSFAKWSFKNGYNQELTLDRIDSKGNYEPSNCRWKTIKEQNNNRSDNRILSYRGKNYTLAQLAEEVSLNRSTLWRRLKKGWSIEDAVKKPLFPARHTSRKDVI